MSEYSELIDNMVWSHSRLTSYETCPYCWYLSYLLKDDENYPRENNYYAENGSLMHETLEKVFKNELSIDDAGKYYIENYENITTKEKKTIMAKTFEACCDYWATVDFEWLKDYEIAGVEKKIEFKINDIKFIGYIDLMLKNKKTGKIVLCDHKSSGTYPIGKNGQILKSCEHTFSKYKTQQLLYSYYINQEYGDYPEELIWNYFKINKIVRIPFVKSELEEAIQWMIDTVNQIKQEENFDAKTDDFFCKNICSFRSSCEYSKVLKEKAKNAWRYKKK